MTYRFIPEARIDLLAAASFYDSQKAGLGAEFVAEFELALTRVLEAPSRWPELEPGIRRYRLKRFPYALIYCIGQQTIDIVAVFDLRRKPGTWRAHRDI